MSRRGKERIEALRSEVGRFVMELLQKGIWLDYRLAGLQACQLVRAQKFCQKSTVLVKVEKNYETTIIS